MSGESVSGTQPMVGTVITVCRPAERSPAISRRCGGVVVSGGMFSKYQSEPVLWMPVVQSYRVVLLPPQRSTVMPSFATAPALPMSEAKFTP